MINKYLVCQTKDAVIDVLKKINLNKKRFCAVLEGKKFVGLVSDGDIRRGLLKKFSVDDKVIKFVNKKVIKSSIEKINKKILDKLKLNNTRYLPILDDNKNLKKILFLNFENNPPTENSNQQLKKKNVTVLIMAGGFGKRLKYLTKNKPKALVKINDKSLIENLIIKLSNEGFKEIFISVFYKRDQIIKKIGSGKKFGVNVNYLIEKKPLGTAGSLFLLKNKKSINNSIFVLNCDLYTTVNFGSILDYHESHNSLATMCGKEIVVKHDFGVINNQYDEISDIVEKPSQKFFFNAGIYVFKKKILNLFKSRNNYLDMDVLFKKIIKQEYKPRIFPIFENWEDCGTLEKIKRIKSNV